MNIDYFSWLAAAAAAAGYYGAIERVSEREALSIHIIIISLCEKGERI
jgi:hypothetical protein